MLKGASLGARSYGDPSVRPFADIDLLTKPADIAGARQFLLSEGFEREYSPAAEPALIRWGHALEFRRGSLKVEMHPGLISHHLRFALTNEMVFADRSRIACAGGEIDILSKPHEFLFLCAHGAKHGWESVRWIADLAQLGNKLTSDDAAAVTRLAAKLHASRLLALGLCVMDDVLNARPASFNREPPHAGQKLRELSGRVRRRIEVAAGGTMPGNAALTWNHSALSFWNAARERWIDRVASIAFVGMVPTEKDAKFGPLGWIGRPARIAFAAARGRLGA